MGRELNIVDFVHNKPLTLTTLYVFYLTEPVLTDNVRLADKVPVYTAGTWCFHVSFQNTRETHCLLTDTFCSAEAASHP